MNAPSEEDLKRSERGNHNQGHILVTQDTVRMGSWKGKETPKK